MPRRKNQRLGVKRRQGREIRDEIQLAGTDASENTYVETVVATGLSDSLETLSVSTVGGKRKRKSLFGYRTNIRTNNDNVSMSNSNFVFASRNQSSEIYANWSRGRQCTANAAVALIFSTVKEIASWEGNDLDIVLDYGDRLYRESIERRGMVQVAPGDNVAYLMVDELSNTVVVGENSFSIEFDDNFTIYGALREDNGENLVNLRNGLQRLSDMGKTIAVLTSNSMSVAIVFSNSRVYVFDPHSRDAKGMPTANGTAILGNFGSLDVATNHLLRVLQPNTNIKKQYTLNPMSVRRLENEPTEEHPVSMTRQRRVRHVDIHKRGEIGVFPLPDKYDLGAMNTTCSFCGANTYYCERPNCCSNGAISLPAPLEYPELLKALLTDSHPLSKSFLRHIRKYNNALQFASVTAQMPNSLGSGVPVYIVCGTIVHNLGAVDPRGKAFGSLHFVDAEEAANRRESNDLLQDCHPNLLRQIDRILRRENRFSAVYQNMAEVHASYERLAEENGTTIPHIAFTFHAASGFDRRRFGAPSNLDELGGVFISPDGQLPPPGVLSVFLKRPDSEHYFQTVSTSSPYADPLCYPLLFPHGELGWDKNIPLAQSHIRKRVSIRKFYVYRFAIRDTVFNAIHHAGKLTQQYAVDAFYKVESERLNYLRLRQDKIRADSYEGLQDYVRNRADKENIPAGRIIILPSTFNNGPRYMQQLFQDAMAVVYRFGMPSYFITFTCNPNWPEIVRQLGKNISPQDRPDIVVRVFEQYRLEFFRDLYVRKIFGEVVAHYEAVEFQLRGLPNTHTVLFVADVDKVRQPEDVDRFISATLPDVELEPELYHRVLRNMIHGPCGQRNPSSPCMEDGACTKKYPHEFREETVLHSGQRVLYKRPEDGRTGTVTRHGKVISIDNRDVVPYSPYLISKYDNHTNVDVCSSPFAASYLFAYVTKGSTDAALIEVRNELVYDEINSYRETRYLSPMEALWRLKGFSTHGCSHTVIRLPIHLPNEKVVYFEEGAEEDALLQAGGKRSMLEAFFDLNCRDFEAHQYTYRDIPEHYRFDSKQCVWVRRQRNIKVIGRMYTISPKYAEKFFLRTLLLNVTAPKSFQDLKEVNGKVYETFRESIIARGLMRTDEEWRRALEEAAKTRLPDCLRKMFAYILIRCEISDPVALWDNFREKMIDDFLRRGLNILEATDRALQVIAGVLRMENTSLSNYGLPEPSKVGENKSDIFDEDFDLANLAEMVEKTEALVSTLNADQRLIFDRVVAVAKNDHDPNRYFFLQGSGGTGKTFLYNAILRHFESRGLCAIAVAFTGIAALLLHHGRTSHSQFKLPLNLEGKVTSRIVAQSEEGRFLRNVRIIIWDEITMTSVHAIDAVDALMKDLRRNDRPFGGVCVLLGGDVKQLLNVATNRCKQVEFFFANCASWSHFRVLQLTKNMRVDTGAEMFAEWLNKLGTGRLQAEPKYGLLVDCVPIPDRFVTKDVVEFVYGDFDPADKDAVSLMSDRVILTPTNKACAGINARMLAKVQGAIFESFSLDEFQSADNDAIHNYPTEFLNACNPSGMPPHKLQLKVGCPVILLRNLNIADGLINGTRLIVIATGQFVITAEISTGEFRARKVLIPRMDLTSEGDRRFPFILKRRQFPLRVCFALTINKAQGQTFDRVGIYLPSPVFSHGQLYVAFSRARNWESVRVQIVSTRDQGCLVQGKKEVFTRNVVYRSVFEKLGIFR